MPVNPVVSTIVNSAVPIETRDKANAILRKNGMTLSGYLRHCLEKLIATNGNPFNPDDHKPLAAHLLAEIEAGGPEAEALLKRLAEIAAMPERAEAA